MNNKPKIIIILALCIFGLSTMALAVGDYQLHWWTVDNGGGSSQSADGWYTLSGTIGQPETDSISGDGYYLQGGFWQSLRRDIQEFLVHLPVVMH